MRVLAGLALVWLAAGTAVDAQSGDHPTAAEIRIELPADAEPRVAVSPGTHRIVIELPEGAVLPLDFAASSAGLLRGGRLTPAGPGRVSLELDLALGLLDRVEWLPGAVVLRFQSRFEARSRIVEPDDEGEQYLIGPDDQLSITVHGQPDLAAKLTVTREGYITAPLVGEVLATGLTPRGLAARLAELLGRDFLVDPQVDVGVETFNSQWVMVAGEIRTPGRVPLRGGTRLKHVLSDAGGFTETAGEEITITRRGATGEPGATEYLERKVFEAGDVNPLLHHEDMVSVGQAKFAYLQGEVGTPSRVRIERDLTLLKAIAQVGGLTDWANRSKVQVLAGDGTKPRTYNLKHIQSGKVVDPVLQGGEIVIVTRRFF